MSGVNRQNGISTTSADFTTKVMFTNSNNYSSILALNLLAG